MEFLKLRIKMPYFFILPVYLLLLLFLGIAALVTHLTPQWRSASRYFVAGALGTIPGFIVANLLATLAAIIPAWIAGHFALPEIVASICTIVTFASLLLGPFAASAMGIILGGFAGCLLVSRQRGAREEE